MSKTEVLPSATRSRALKSEAARLIASAGKDKSQSDKFRDLARDLGADEDEASFENHVKRIAKSAPPSKSNPNAGDVQP